MQPDRWPLKDLADAAADAPRREEKEHQVEQEQPAIIAGDRAEQAMAMTASLNNRRQSSPDLSS